MPSTPPDLAGDPADPRSPAGPSQIYRIAWAIYLGLTVGATLWLGLREGRIGLERFFQPATWPIDLAIGFGAAAALLALWHGAARLLPAARALERRLAELLGPLGLSEALALALISGLAEEYFFRGAMQSAWGWLPATLVFTLLHTGPGPGFRLWTLFAAVAGLVFAGLVLWRGNLLPAIVAHTVVNGVNLGLLARRARVGAETPG